MTPPDLDAISQAFAKFKIGPNRQGFAVFDSVKAVLAAELARLQSDWTPTAANVNALPDPVRRYVHDLETRCDPAGDVARLSLLQDENAQLRAKILAMAERIAAQAELLAKKAETVTSSASSGPAS